MQRRKIPVFYHIPKNAGTYVSDWMLTAFRHYRRTYTNWLENYSSEKDTIKCFQILKNGFKIAKFLIGDPFHFCEEYPKIIAKHSRTEWDIDLEDITQDFFGNTFLFGIIIESHGFKIANEILKLLTGWNLHQFIILRDSFSRAQSIYHYNISESSKHDYNHGLIKSKTFEQYILSDEIEDSWLIRTFLNLKNSEAIEECHYNETASLLREFRVYDIKEADKAIREAVKLCYGFDISQINLNSWDSINKNETNYKKINIEELSEKAQEVFKQRTIWDQKLYKQFK